MKCQVRETVQQDIPWVANNLRDADILDLDGVHPAVALGVGLELSEQCWTLTVDGLPTAIFGVNRGPAPQDHIGGVWLLGTPVVEKISLYFLRHSKEWLAKLEQGFLLLQNRLHKDNHLHRRWLKWLGFRGVGQQGQFIVFVKECANV